MPIIKAAVAHAFGQPLAVEDVHLSAPKLGEVEVTLEACAICHSDITYLDSGWADPYPPSTATKPLDAYQRWAKGSQASAKATQW